MTKNTLCHSTCHGQEKTAVTKIPPYLRGLLSFVTASQRHGLYIALYFVFILFYFLSIDNREKSCDSCDNLFKTPILWEDFVISLDKTAVTTAVTKKAIR